MKVLNLLISGNAGGIESLCNNIDKYSNIDNYWVFLFSGGKIADMMRERNPERVYILGYSKIKIHIFLKKLEMICKEKKIEIINIHHASMYGNILYTKLQKKFPNIKFVRTLHSCYEDKYTLKGNFLKNCINLYFLNKALQVSDLIVCVSNAVKITYKNKFNISHKKIVVIYNGIDKKFYTERLKERNNAGLINLVYVGRLEKVKGVDILLEAFAELPKELNAHLTIVGDGKERKNLMEQSKVMKIEDKIEFLGTRTDIIQILDEADIFVYPSIWKEAFGISVVEAMARGCIPVTFNKGGLPEIIKNGENGFLVYETIANSLSEIIKKVILSDNKKELKEKAIETAQKFSIENTILKLEREYVKLIKEGYTYDKQLENKKK